MKKSDFLRIYLVRHLPLSLPETAIFEPIDAGRKDGNQIADWQNWAELRAQYWVLNNTDLPKYVGFFHFRRYLLPVKKAGLRPYRLDNQPLEKHLSEEKWTSLLADADIVAPIPEYTGLTVRERYALYPNQDYQDLRAVEEIVCNLHPGYRLAVADYLNGKREYYGNIYIMRRDVFRAYCAWLFPILIAFRKQRPDAKPRAEGYLAERLFGIWLTEQATNNGMRIKKLPRVHFSCYDDSTHQTTSWMRLRNILLPPGSWLKGLVARIKFGKTAKKKMQQEKPNL